MGSPISSMEGTCLEKKFAGGVALIAGADSTAPNWDAKSGRCSFIVAAKLHCVVVAWGGGENVKMRVVGEWTNLPSCLSHQQGTTIRVRPALVARSFFRLSLPFVSSKGRGTLDSLR